MVEKVDKALVLKQLESITTSNDFKCSARTKGLLSHLVFLELEGRGDELHGTALAMDVFGRGADFDPTTDPVVRTEAVKLRKALSHYYLSKGKNDPLIISVPKGQYRPLFEAKVENASLPDSSSSHDKGWPVLGIGIFTGSDTTRAKWFREGFPEELGLELTRFAHVRVLTGFPDRSSVWNNENLKPNCDYFLHGSVRDTCDKLHLIVQLQRKRDGSILWADRRDINPDATDSF
ncbi:hypothetical protein [Ruegeria sp. HKCCA5426]|uniref:hypothetical protein n=1 Tax=Ruegeria sp. HKCCA5426 TaxID=2682985 RepID=UPI001487CE94|nr:hypothetical protein [Ruegeria sp. HKCCA5426]